MATTRSVRLATASTIANFGIVDQARAGQIGRSWDKENIQTKNNFLAYDICIFNIKLGSIRSCNPLLFFTFLQNIL